MHHASVISVILQELAAVRKKVIRRQAVVLQYDGSLNFAKCPIQPRRNSAAGAHVRGRNIREMATWPIHTLDYASYFFALPDVLGPIFPG